LNFPKSRAAATLDGNANIATALAPRKNDRLLRSNVPSVEFEPLLLFIISYLVTSVESLQYLPT
jgi:hypothetical protein